MKRDLTHAREKILIICGHYLEWTKEGKKIHVCRDTYGWGGRSRHSYNSCKILGNLGRHNSKTNLSLNFLLDLFYPRILSLIA